MKTLQLLFLALATTSLFAADDKCSDCANPVRSRIVGYVMQGPSKSQLTINLGSGMNCTLWNSVPLLIPTPSWKSCAVISNGGLTYTLKGNVRIINVQCFAKTKQADLETTLLKFTDGIKNLAAKECPGGKYLTDIAEITKDNALKISKLNSDKCKGKLHEVQKSIKDHGDHESQLSIHMFYDTEIGLDLTMRVVNGTGYFASVKLVKPFETYGVKCGEIYNGESALTVACDCLAESTFVENFGKAVIRYILACQSQSKEYENVMKSYTCVL